MPNQSGHAYGLTTLCPIANGVVGETSLAAATRAVLQQLPLHEDSPLAKVPNTYLCRLFVLNDVAYQGAPAALDRLKSKYLVFTSNFHGERDPYLRGMWETAESTVREIWQHCVGFDRVKDAATFVEYIARCQVETTFFFVGSTDDPLDEQLKALYLKQEFSQFAFENQGMDAASLQKAFREFWKRTRPTSIEGPTWRPGACNLDEAVINAGEGSR